VSLLLAGFMCLVPFLIPYHQLPPRSFYPEWLAAALGLIAFLATLASPRFRSPVPPIALAAARIRDAAAENGECPGHRSACCQIGAQ